MTEFTREFFKNDVVFFKLWTLLKSKHRVPKHEIETHEQNKYTKDFCVMSRNFFVLPEDEKAKAIYLHYDTASWLKENGILVVIEKIGVYDNYVEYQVERMKGLHSGRPSDIPTSNLN